MAEGSSGGIEFPVATFISDIEQYLAGRDPEVALKEQNRNFQIYKSMEQQLLQRKTRLLNKIPDLKKTLEMVKHLIEKDGAEMKVDYSLADQIHASAKLKDVKHVKLWLGADIMLEYELEEAETELANKLKIAEETSDRLTKDLELMKDYITITEVSLARLFNYDVAKRRKKDKPTL